MADQVSVAPNKTPNLTNDVSQISIKILNSAPMARIQPAPPHSAVPVKARTLLIHANTILLTSYPDTYTGCAWYGDDYCTKSCPSDKILITQRSEIEDLQIEQGLPGGYDECVTGYLKYCCDPPTATTDWPVSPTDLFEYPDTTHVSYEYVKEDSSYDDCMSILTALISHTNY